VHGKRAITADTALCLARYFGMSERFWLNLQARHDLEVEKGRLGNRLKKEVAVLARGELIGRLTQTSSPGRRGVGSIPLALVSSYPWFRRAQPEALGQRFCN